MQALSGWWAARRAWLEELIDAMLTPPAKHGWQEPAGPPLPASVKVLLVRANSPIMQSSPSAYPEWVSATARTAVELAEGQGISVAGINGTASRTVADDVAAELRIAELALGWEDTFDSAELLLEQIERSNVPGMVLIVAPGYRIFGLLGESGIYRHDQRDGWDTRPFDVERFEITFDGRKARIRSDMPRGRS